MNATTCNTEPNHSELVATGLGMVPVPEEIAQMVENFFTAYGQNFQ